MQTLRPRQDSPNRTSWGCSPTISIGTHSPREFCICWETLNFEDHWPKTLVLILTAHYRALYITSGGGVWQSSFLTSAHAMPVLARGPHRVPRAGRQLLLSASTHQVPLIMPCEIKKEVLPALPWRYPKSDHFSLLHHPNPSHHPSLTWMTVVAFQLLYPHFRASLLTIVFCIAARVTILNFGSDHIVSFFAQLPYMVLHNLQRPPVPSLWPDFLLFSLSSRADLNPKHIPATGPLHMFSSLPWKLFPISTLLVPPLHSGLCSAKGNFLTILFN